MILTNKPKPSPNKMMGHFELTWPFLISLLYVSQEIFSDINSWPGVILNWNLQCISPQKSGKSSMTIFGIILEYETSKLSIIFLIEAKHAVDNLTPGQVKKQVTKSTIAFKYKLYLVCLSTYMIFKMENIDEKKYLLNFFFFSHQGGNFSWVHFCFTLFQLSCWNHSILRVWSFLVW